MISSGFQAGQWIILGAPPWRWGFFWARICWCWRHKRLRPKPSKYDGAWRVASVESNALVIEREDPVPEPGPRFLQPRTRLTIAQREARKRQRKERRRQRRRGR